MGIYCRAFFCWSKENYPQ